MAEASTVPCTLTTQRAAPAREPELVPRRQCRRRPESSARFHSRHDMLRLLRPCLPPISSVVLPAGVGVSDIAGAHGLFDRSRPEQRTGSVRRIPLGRMGRFSDLLQVSALVCGQDQPNGYWAGKIMETILRARDYSEFLPGRKASGYSTRCTKIPAKCCLLRTARSVQSKTTTIARGSPAGTIRA